MDQAKTVVIIGHQANGKTTLMNKLCNTNEPVKYGGNSCTQEIFYKYAAHESPFIVIDTPGFGDEINKFKQASKICAALEIPKIHKVLWVVKFQPYNHLIRNISDMIQLLEDYLDLIIIVVTHCDKMENQERDQAETRGKIKTQLHLTKLIFSSKQKTTFELCTEIHNELIEAPPQTIKISNRRFQLSFDLAVDFQELRTSNNSQLQQQVDKIETKLQEDKSKLKTIMIKAVQTMRMFINQKLDQSRTDIDQVMDALITWIKNYAEQQTRIFETENVDLMEELHDLTKDMQQAYFYYLDLKKSIRRILTDAIQVAQKLCTFHIQLSSQIRKCPYCGEIWMKVFGCELETICGNRYKFKDILEQTFFYRYEIVYDPEQETIIIESNSSYTRQLKAPQQDLQRNSTDKKEIARGCGKRIIWQDLNPLTQVEIDNLQKVGLDDFLFGQENQQVQDLNFDFHQKRNNLQKLSIEQIKIDVSNLNLDTEIEKQAQENMIKQNINDATMRQRNDASIMAHKEYNRKLDTQGIELKQNYAIMIGSKKSRKIDLIKMIPFIQKLNDTQYKYEYKDKTYFIKDSIELIREAKFVGRFEDYKTQQHKFFVQVHDTHLNQIFIISRYKYQDNEQKFNKIKKDLDLCMPALKKYANIITLIITKWELSIQQQVQKQSIETFVSSFYQIRSFLFIESSANVDLPKLLEVKFSKSRTINLEGTLFDQAVIQLSQQQLPQRLTQIQQAPIQAPQVPVQAPQSQQNIVQNQQAQRQYCSIQ